MIACHICKFTGEHTCDLSEAEIKCVICGKCEGKRLVRLNAIPNNPIPSIHSLHYFSCGLNPDKGHFHVTERGAVKCIAKQKKAATIGGEP